VIELPGVQRESNFPADEGIMVANAFRQIEERAHGIEKDGLDH
jgi:hypothetical protein